MTIKQVTECLESWAPLYLQEQYDNAGLISGDDSWNCTGIICCLDATEAVITEAIQKKCNLVIAHHPIIFRALKKFTQRSFVERTIIKAIKNDIAIYAIHTNLDNITGGVNTAMSNRLGLLGESRRILSPKNEQLAKLYTYVPLAESEKVKTALFEAGAGAIGNYRECSFSVTGTGTFKPMEGANPFIGSAGGNREEIPEIKMEFLFSVGQQQKILQSLFAAHPYETVAYEIIKLENTDQTTGSGLIGELPEAINERDFLNFVKHKFQLTSIKHTPLLEKPVKKVALCGGSGSFLIQKAIAEKADVFITSDIKYHDFFEADGKILLLDIGHWESEQFTIELVSNFLQDKIPTFAVLKTEINTNPVHHFV
ncbi:MAG: Nif3-like dinuclear metal center hexameric protein [Bacteroidota bacterium]